MTIRLCELIDEWMKEQMLAFNYPCDVYGYEPVIHKLDPWGKHLSCHISKEVSLFRPINHAYIESDHVEVLIDPDRCLVPGPALLSASDPEFFEKLAVLLKIAW